MKRTIALIMAVLMICAMLASCGAKAYVGTWEMEGASLMGTEITLTVENDGTFEMYYGYDNYEATISGNYEETNENEIQLNAEKMVSVVDGEETEEESGDNEPLIVKYEDEKLKIDMEGTEITFKKAE